MYIYILWIWIWIWEALCLINHLPTGMKPSGNSHVISVAPPMLNGQLKQRAQLSEICPLIAVYCVFGHDTVGRQHVFKCFIVVQLYLSYVCISRSHMFAVYGGISIYNFVKYICLFIFAHTHAYMYKCIDHTDTICRSTMMCICLETIGPIGDNSMQLFSFCA